MGLGEMILKWLAFSLLCVAILAILTTSEAKELVSKEEDENGVVK